MRAKKTQTTKKVNQNHNSKLYPISCLGFLLGFNMALVLNPPQALALEIGYSGRLQEESGKSIEGPLDFTVKFYNDLSGGDTVGPVLNLSNTELRDGVFQLSLNFDNGQLSSIFGDGSKSAFVEVTAGGKVYPRQRLIAVPLALRVPVDTNTLNYTNDGKLTVEYVDISKITGITAALAAKADASVVTKMTNNLSDLSDKSVARNHLGLGTLATASSVTSSMIANNTIVDSNISSSAAIADTKLAAITTAGKVSGSAITSGTIGGTTAINSSGAITTSGAVTVAGTITGTGNVVVNGTGTATTALRFNDIDNTNYVGFKAPDTLAGDRIWTLPSADGSSGQALTTNGTGALAWSTLGGGGSLTLSSKSSDYTVVTGDVGKYFMVKGELTTLTLPTAASVGSGFSITVKSNGGWAVVTRSGSDMIEGAATALALPTQSVAQLVTDGTAWYLVYSLGTYYRGTPVSCGADCYANGSAMSAGLAYTATGKTVALSNGVWVQANGTNVLRVDGSDNWHLALNGDGRTFSASNLNKTTANLGGRVCPVNVYVDDGDRAAIGRCVYYDSGTPSTILGAVTEQTSAFQIGPWNTAAGGNGTSASWYEGNFKICADKGMRLPLLYETTASDPGVNKPADPASPSWSNGTTGVPSYGNATWTSSASSDDPNYYWIWIGTSTSVTWSSFLSYSLRCVVP